MNEPSVTKALQLQLSHVQMNVETASREVSLEQLQNASIEPRSDERGNQMVMLRNDEQGFFLQLSHVQMNVETSRRASGLRASRSFN